MAVISKQYFLVGTTDALLMRYVDPINGAVVSSSPVNITVQADASQVDALDEYMAAIGWIPGTLSLPDLGWYGTGVDGDLVFDGASTVVGLTPVANVYTMEQDIFANNLTVNAGVTIVTAGFRIYVAATLTILATGFISNDGQSSLLGDGSPGAGAPTGNVLGGGNGGAGGFNGNDGSPGDAVSFYPSRSVGNNGGVGGDSVNQVGGAGGLAIPQLGFGTYMISQIVLGDAVSGGPGGGGGGGDAGVVGGGGGGGGGCMVLAAQHFVVPANAIHAIGGAGDNGSAADSGGGGGGTGGTICIVTNDSVAPTVDVSGGAGGNGAGGGTPGSPGSAGVVIAISPVFGPL